MPYDTNLMYYIIFELESIEYIPLYMLSEKTPIHCMNT